jgi:hypothetical protein
VTIRAALSTPAFANVRRLGKTVGGSELIAAQVQAGIADALVVVARRFGLEPVQEAIRLLACLGKCALFCSALTSMMGWRK